MSNIRLLSLPSQAAGRGQNRPILANQTNNHNLRILSILEKFNRINVTWRADSGTAQVNRSGCFTFASGNDCVNFGRAIYDLALISDDSPLKASGLELIKKGTYGMDVIKMSFCEANCLREKLDDAFQTIAVSYSKSVLAEILIWDDAYSWQANGIQVQSVAALESDPDIGQDITDTLNWNGLGFGVPHGRSIDTQPLVNKLLTNGAQYELAKRAIYHLESEAVLNFVGMKKYDVSKAVNGSATAWNMDVFDPRIWRILWFMYQTYTNRFTAEQLTKYGIWGVESGTGENIVYSYEFSSFDDFVKGYGGLELFTRRKANKIITILLNAYPLEILAQPVISGWCERFWFTAKADTTKSPSADPIVTPAADPETVTGDDSPLGRLTITGIPVPSVTQVEPAYGMTD